MVTADRDVLTLARLTVLTTVAELGSYARAAKSLGVTVQAVRKSMEVLRTFYGAPLLRDGDHGLELTGLGHEVHEVAEQMQMLGKGLSQLAATHRPHLTVAFLPHHAEFVAPAIRELEQVMEIKPEVLGEEDRSTRRFQDVVLRRVDVGAYDIAIGPPPEPQGDFKAVPLYDAVMMALLPRAWEQPFITIPDLLSENREVARHADSVAALPDRLLLPPSATRAGATIRTEIELEMGWTRERTDERVLLSAFGTKVLAIFGKEALGTVIVPSDIAFAFGPGGTLQGEALRSWHWVRLLRTRKDPAGAPWSNDDGADDGLITHEVKATTSLVNSRKESVVKALSVITRHARRILLEGESGCEPHDPSRARARARRLAQARAGASRS